MMKGLKSIESTILYWILRMLIHSSQYHWYCLITSNTKYLGHLIWNPPEFSLFPSFITPSPNPSPRHPLPTPNVTEKYVLPISKHHRSIYVDNRLHMWVPRTGKIDKQLLFCKIAEELDRWMSNINPLTWET